MSPLPPPGPIPTSRELGCHVAVVMMSFLAAFFVVLFWVASCFVLFIRDVWKRRRR